MNLRKRVLELLARRLNRPLPLRLSFWDGEDYEFSDAPAVTVTLRTPRCGMLMLTGNLDRLCDAYLSGEVMVEGAMRDILNVGLEIAGLIDRFPLASKLMRIVARSSPKPHSRAQDAKQVQWHYDVSNDFYELWLDKYLIHSCAYFRDGTRISTKRSARSSTSSAASSGWSRETDSSTSAAAGARFCAGRRSAIRSTASE